MNILKVVFIFFFFFFEISIFNIIFCLYIQHSSVLIDKATKNKKTYESENKPIKNQELKFNVTCFFGILRICIVTKNFYVKNLNMLNLQKPKGKM